jgi:hypothetical protein
VAGRGYVAQVGVGGTLTVLIVVGEANDVHFYNGQIGFMQDPRLLDFASLVSAGRIKEYPLKESTASPEGVHFVTKSTGTTYDLTASTDGTLRGWVRGIYNGSVFNSQATFVPVP